MTHTNPDPERLLLLTQAHDDPTAARYLWQLAKRLGDPSLKHTAAAHLWRLGLWRCDIAAHTLRGPHRAYNESLAFHETYTATQNTPEHWACVCHGHGGHANGVIASAIAFWLTRIAHTARTQQTTPTLTPQDLASFLTPPPCWLDDTQTLSALAWLQDQARNHPAAPGEDWFASLSRSALLVAHGLPIPIDAPASPTDPNRETWLRALFRLLHATMFHLTEIQTRQNSFRGSFLELSSIWLHGHQLTLSHIGQSAIYLTRPNAQPAHPVRLTRPHSLLQDMRDQGHTPTPEQITQYKRIISRGFGLSLAPAPNNTPDFATLALEPTDQFLLCSPGVTEALAETNIFHLWRTASTPAAACDAILSTAAATPNSGNLACVCVALSEVGV